MVVSTPKLKRENGGSGHQQSQPQKPSSFGKILEKTAADNCPEEIYTVTYDRNSRLQTFYYRQSKEYTF